MRTLNIIKINSDFGLKLVGLVMFLVFLSQLSWAASPAVRLKDIAHILEARDNQLMGFGLVVGLHNTGDKTRTGFTEQALTNLLSRMGLVPQAVDFKSRNVAAVMVTATLPPFVKSGQKLDVTVSSVGDSASLQGGTLLVTPLYGVDGQVYAVAQGGLLIGGESGSPTVPYAQRKVMTVGRVPQGALVEKEVPVSIGDRGMLTIVIDEPDFTTAARVVSSIKKLGLEAVATDAGAVVVSLSTEIDVIGLIAKIENVKIIPDGVAKIVINERTGTIVMGENVKISPVAVSYAGLDVSIGDVALFSEGNSGDQADDAAHFRSRSMAHLEKKEEKLTLVPAGATLLSLVNALNRVGASPKDLIAILQAMKRAGAIKAELEVI